MSGLQEWFFFLPLLLKQPFPLGSHSGFPGGIAKDVENYRAYGFALLLRNKVTAYAIASEIAILVPLG